MLDVFKKKLDSIAAIDLDALFVRVMLMPEISNRIISLNQSQMYDLGVDSEGVPLGEYTPFSKMMKERNGDATVTLGDRTFYTDKTDHITLLEKGDMYGSMEVIQKDSDKVVVSADMQKPNQNLEDRWPYALGLTQDSINIIRPLFNRLFLTEWKKQVNLIMYGKAA